MNGSPPGTSSGVKKSKDIMSLPPVDILNFTADIASGKEWVKTFIQAKTADEQLSLLKENLVQKKDPVDANIVKFLMVIFFHSEAKHPIKCFLTRYVTKSKHLQETFIALLTSEITLHLKNNRDDVLCYKDTIPKIGMCLENFPAGTRAVEDAAEKIVQYLLWFLDECVSTFRNGFMPKTKKNAICSLVHSALKIVLHIITKPQWKVDGDSYSTPSHAKLFQDFHNCRILETFLYDKEVPMDTKSLCGLVIISLEAYLYCDEVQPDSWKTFMHRRQIEKENDDVQLALYSAIVTTVPIQNLQEKYLFNEAPITIIVIVQRFMDIIERNASEGVLVLGVARSLLHLSKGLPRLRPEPGRQVTRALLAFVWSHLDHFMDSMRHLTAHILSSVVAYCAVLEEHDPECGALEEVMAGVSRLEAARRGYCAGVRGCVAALGARRVLRRLAPLPRLLTALTQPQPATAVVSTLAELLARHAQEVGAAVIHDEWLVPILTFVRTHDLSPEVITILENLLAQAVKLDQELLGYILPHIKQACESADCDLKNVLVLLSVTRGSLTKLASDPQFESQELWGGVLPYDILNAAVVDAQEEVRLAGLALACGGAGGGAVRAGEVRVVLRYLAYCGAERQPHVRQRGLAMLHKFVKRLFDGYRAAKRSGDEERCQMYRDFDDQLRRQCYSALQPGASYPRRATALQLLQALEPRPLEHRDWKEDYVEKLLLHLDDSYETNKALALEILQHVPLDLLKDKNYSVSLKLEDIIRQADALKPAECVAAAYKLELVWRRQPDNIPVKDSSIPEAVAWHAASALVQVHAGTCGPAPPPAGAGYGALHCLAHVLDRLEPAGIAACPHWRVLIDRIIHVCDRMLEIAGKVVNTAAPEGALPQRCLDWGYGDNTFVMVEEECAVSAQAQAQAVLLGAWRTVKEATAVLSAIGSRLDQAEHVMIQLAERLASVLTEARHRGAVELAHVATARLLHRMWRDRRPMVQEYPARMLARLLAALRELGARPADRRSAGVPFYFQALVSTEVNAGGPGSALHQVMKELLSLAEADAEAGADAAAAANLRAHACNILRALYKDATLDTAVQSYVGEGLRVALKGFEGATWSERNSSTLLLSALMTRVFGVWRTRSALSARNRMTGRVFYLRYPTLYDIMLNKLKEASDSEEKLLLCPSLYPVLLILGRLYPSSLEGTESNLKLVSFVPHVVRCARSRVLHTRRLAAAACVALVAPDRYVRHVQHLLGLLSDEKMNRNFCHGLLLQVCALLDNKPYGVDCGSLTAHIASTQWMLRQRPPCYPLLHQYVQMLTTLLTRCGDVRQETRDTISARLSEIVFQPSGAGAGRELCLAAALRLMLALGARADRSADVILRAVQHEVHEVSAAALDCLLALYGRGADADADAEAEVNVAMMEAEAIVCELRGRADYLPRMADALRSEALWRCDPQRAAKYLEVLVAEGGTQELVLAAPSPRTEAAVRWYRRPYHGVIPQLILQIDFGPEAVAHLYLESLISYAVGRAESLTASEWNHLLYVMCGAAGGASVPRARRLVAAALHQHAARMLHAAAGAGADAGASAESCILVSTARLLRAAEGATRALAAGAVLSLATNGCGRAVVPERAGALLLAECAGRARALELLSELALADGLHVPGRDQHAPREECRVFDKESENVDDEEVVWTAACAAEVVDLCRRQGVDPLAHIFQLIDKGNFRVHFDANLLLMARGGEDVSNPLVKVFIRKLKGEI